MVHLGQGTWANCEGKERRRTLPHACTRAGVQLLQRLLAIVMGADARHLPDYFSACIVPISRQTAAGCSFDPVKHDREKPNEAVC